MPITLTQYWDALEQDVLDLRRAFGTVFDYQNYLPTIAAINMAKAGRRFELASGLTWINQLLAIERDIKKHEVGIGDRINDFDIYQPRLNNHQDFFFAISFYCHQIRFADVQTVSNMINKGVQSRKTQIASMAAEVGQLICQYYSIHQQSLNEQFPRIIASQGITIIDKVVAFLRLPVFIVALDSELVTTAEVLPGNSFESIMATVIQHEFEEIIENGIDAYTIVTQLQEHFCIKEQTITRMYHARLLLDHLNQQGTSLANLDIILKTNFLNLLSNIDRLAWERQIESALVSPIELNSVVIEPDLLGKNLRQNSARATNRLWSFSQRALEGTVALIKPWSPTFITNFAQTVYNVSTKITKHAFAVGTYLVAGTLENNLALDHETVLDDQTKRKLTLFVNTYYKTVAQELITPDSNLRLGSESPEELLRLKDKLSIFNTVLVLDKQMDNFINTHNQGLVKFIDFFQLINQFLSRTFFRNILHDKALLLEEARRFKQSLGSIKQEFDQNIQEIGEIKKQLLDCANITKCTVSGVTLRSRYVFLNQTHKKNAQLAALEFASIIEKATVLISAPAA